MLSREELIAMFGEENIIALDFRSAIEVGLSEYDALILSHVGFPRKIGAVFTAELDGSPALFSVQRFEDPSGMSNSALFLGAPGSDQSLRYFLDVKEGFVVLCSLDDSNPEAEIVNSDLSSFVDFIHRIGVRFESDEMGRDEEISLANELEFQLKQRDSYAFRHPDTWWSIFILKVKERAHNLPEGRESFPS